MAHNIHIDNKDGYYSCKLCNRQFASENGLFTHCRTTSRHEWCEQCSQAFPNLEAKKQHIKDSRSHNLCSECGTDFSDRSGLDKHLIDVHNYCKDCNMLFTSSKNLEQHDIERHNLCTTCGNHFNSENGLYNHRKSHGPRNAKCFGCCRKFKTTSDILAHLESGACTSDITEGDSDDIALDLKDREDYVFWPTDKFSYYCLNCHQEYNLLSSLYRHCENSEECSDLLDDSNCLSELTQHLCDEVPGL